MMAGNKLTSLPEEMAGCQELELLRLAANDLKELPSWLLKLPKLSWLAFAGNPLGSARTTAVGIYTNGRIHVCMYVYMFMYVCMYVHFMYVHGYMATLLV